MTSDAGYYLTSILGLAQDISEISCRIDKVGTLEELWRIVRFI